MSDISIGKKYFQDHNILYWIPFHFLNKHLYKKQTDKYERFFLDNKSNILIAEIGIPYLYEKFNNDNICYWMPYHYTEQVKHVIDNQIELVFKDGIG